MKPAIKKNTKSEQYKRNKYWKIWLDIQSKSIMYKMQHTKNEQVENIRKENSWKYFRHVTYKYKQKIVTLK